MRKLAWFLLLISFILPCAGLWAQEKKLYRWEGDWQWVDEKKYHYNFSCYERFFTIDNECVKNARGNIIQVYLDIRGIRKQFVVMNRYYWWDREYFKVGRGTWGNDEFASAYNIGEASKIIMEEAVGDYVRDACKQKNKAAQNSSSGSSAKTNTASAKKPYALSLNSSAHDDAQDQLRRAREYYGKGNYKMADMHVRMSLIFEDAKDAREFKVLVDKKLAEQKAPASSGSGTAK